MFCVKDDKIDQRNIKALHRNCKGRQFPRPSFPLSCPLISYRDDLPMKPPTWQGGCRPSSPVCCRSEAPSSWARAQLRADPARRRRKMGCCDLRTAPNRIGAGKGIMGSIRCPLSPYALWVAVIQIAFDLKPPASHVIDAHVIDAGGRTGATERPMPSRLRAAILL
jgi:hypothetical protein